MGCAFFANNWSLVQVKYWAVRTGYGCVPGSESGGNLSPRRTRWGKASSETTSVR
jgi:hypothetical protein